MKTFVMPLIIYFCSATASAAPQISSELMWDLLKNLNQQVNTANSNSPGCDAACTLEKYLQVQMKNISEDLSMKTDSAESENSKPGAVFKGSCKGHKRPHMYSEFAKPVIAKLPKNTKLTLCKFDLAFQHEESVWSETLYYLKDTKTDQVLAGSFWAFGTP